MNIFINQIAHMLLAKEKKTKNGEKKKRQKHQLHEICSVLTHPSKFSTSTWMCAMGKVKAKASSLSRK